MKIFRKYEFGSQSAATTKINALGVDEDGVPTPRHSVARLGHIVTTQPTYDADGNVDTPAVLSDNYHVDVLWHIEEEDGVPEASWDAQMIWCKGVGVHSFGCSSAQAEYDLKCREVNPDWFPTPDPEGTEPDEDAL